MSKRAEKAARRAFPFRAASTKMYDGQTVTYDGNEAKREIFQQGYEQAEEYTICTVKTWLSEIHRVCDITDENGYRVELRNLVASLEKTMEEK